ncbi:MAG: nucleotidyl transferase AbiEii/AbiGii toxin family protein [Gammaproteobacteria bacterium]
MLNKARSDQRPFNELLQYYAMERFLYRFSRSQHAERFVLKGALMLRVWRSPLPRATMDIDMLARTSNREAALSREIRDILAVEVEADGLRFDASSLRFEKIMEDADYQGVRIRLQGDLDTARVALQIDIGFGDIAYPEPVEAELPGMLNFPPPRLLCYSRESTIAEKFEAMVKLGELNSRMKDFYDIWLLSRQFDFDGEVLNEAIRLTFNQRRTEIPERVVALSEEFGWAKQIQWQAFRRRLGQENAPEMFAEIIGDLHTFLNPVAIALRMGRTPPGSWKAPGPWSEPK